MSTADFPAPFAEKFALRQAHDLSRTRATGQLDSSMAQWWFMFFASTFAVITSGYLAWSSFTSSPVAGCGSGGAFDCGHVLHSRWSTVLSLPVSVPAIATHLTVLAMLFWKPVGERSIRARWSMIGFSALAAGGAAIWFIALQVFWLQHLCGYCLAAHVSGIILAVTFLFMLPISGLRFGWLALAAAASLASLISLQLLNETPASYEIIEYGDAVGTEGSINSAPTAAPASRMGDASDESEANVLFDAPKRQASKSQQDAQVAQMIAVFFHPASLLYGQVSAAQPESPTALVMGNIELRTDAWPLLGKPDAEMVFVELFDYTCPHCQRTHRSLEAAREHFGDKLAVITMPVPLDRKCNASVKTTHPSHSESCEIAKLAVAVWCVDRSQFEAFHDELFESTPSYSQALAKARTLVDEEELNDMLNSSLPSDYVAKHVTMYQRAGAGTIPKLLFPRTSSVGAVESPSAMIRLIEQHL